MFFTIEIREVSGVGNIHISRGRNFHHQNFKLGCIEIEIIVLTPTARKKFALRKSTKTQTNVENLQNQWRKALNEYTQTRKHKHKPKTDTSNIYII